MIKRKAVGIIEDQSNFNTRYAPYCEFSDDKFYILKVYDIIRGLSYFDNFKVLDVGCSDGSFAEKLKKDFSFNIYGVDISKKAVKLAKSKGIKATTHNLENALPYPDNTFDMVISCEVIEHVYDTDFLLQETRRVLKKGGLLIISTPNLASLTNRIKLLLGMYPNFVPEYKAKMAGHIRAYTVPILHKQLKEHNLKPILTVSPNITFPMASKKVPLFLKELAFKLGNFFPTFGSHIIVVSKKRGGA